MSPFYLIGQDSKHALDQHKSETFPLPDPFHTSDRIGRDQKSHYTTFDTDPLCRVVPRDQKTNERSDVDYPLCVPGRMFRLTKLVNIAEPQFRCIAVL